MSSTPVALPLLTDLAVEEHSTGRTVKGLHENSLRRHTSEMVLPFPDSEEN